MAIALSVTLVQMASANKGSLFPDAMLILLLFLKFLRLSDQSEDFDNAKILGKIMRKMYNPACIQDYSANIQRNATFKANLRNCMDILFLNNGSRVFSGHIEIGFHPLVITSNDRLYSVKCIDNSYAIAHQAAKNQDKYCSHTIRLASRWESSTVFHVGDAVVHEWNCNFPVKEGQKYQTFLTSCNAISSSGQIIHLVDENGCIVDSELIGEVVYNSFMPKVYRIECLLQMCTTEGICKDRVFPPKCAFTKEEILNRYASKTKVDALEDTFMTGTINNRYELQVKVVSEWITVHNNQYTNIEQLQERFYLTAVINEEMEEPKVQTTPRHFLMGISYRSPNNTDPPRNESEDNDNSTSALIEPSGAFVIQNPTISSGEVDNIEVTTTTAEPSDPSVSVTETSETASETTLSREFQSESVASNGLLETSPTSRTSSAVTSSRKIPKPKTTLLLHTSSSTRTSTDSSTRSTSALESYFSRKKAMNTTRARTTTNFSSSTTASPIATESTSAPSTQNASPTREKPATLLFYTNRSST
ncbi:hypothetical protein COOONC_02086 [Cooperia oncophora]